MIQNDQSKKHSTIPNGSNGIYKQKLDFLKCNTPLPSLEQFDLEKVLATELKEESDQVISSLLQVAGDYQNDLRLCIKNKLSIEQRIQFKNIEVAKLAHYTNSKLERSTDKLDKVINKKGKNVNETKLDQDIDSLLELSAKLSSSVKSLTVRLADLDSKINNGNSVLDSSVGKIKYPLLAKLVPKVEGTKATSIGNKNHKSSTTQPYNDNSHNTEGSLKRTEYNAHDVQNISKDKNDSITEGNPEDTHDSITVDNPKLLNNNKGTKLDDSSTHSSNKSVQLNIEERNTKGHLQPIEDESEMDPEEFENFINSSINKYRQQQEGKYNSLKISGKLSIADEVNGETHSSNIIEIDESEEHPIINTVDNPISLLYSPITSNILSTNHNLNKIGIKSAATVTKTLEISHSKKLRINGSGNKKQENRDKDDTHHERSLQERLEEVLLDSEEDYHDSILSSESSDSDNLDPDPSSLSNAMNKYYFGLRKNHTKKDRKNLEADLRRPGSPLLKHQPSHHKLKPMRSILKNNTKKGPADQASNDSHLNFENEDI